MLVKLEKKVLVIKGSIKDADHNISYDIGQHIVDIKKINGDFELKMTPNDQPSEEPVAPKKVEEEKKRKRAPVAQASKKKKVDKAAAPTSASMTPKIAFAFANEDVPELPIDNIGGKCTTCHKKDTLPGKTVCIDHDDSETLDQTGLIIE